MRLSGLGRKRCLPGRKEKAMGGQEETLGRILQASCPASQGNHHHPCCVAADVTGPPDTAALMSLQPDSTLERDGRVVLGALWGGRGDAVAGPAVIDGGQLRAEANGCSTDCCQW